MPLGIQTKFSLKSAYPPTKQWKDEINARRSTLKIQPVSQELFSRPIGFNVLSWPSVSPDLNPIEHIWDVIGQRVRSRVPLNIRDLERFVVEVWNGVAQLTFRNYIASMRSRCQAVVNANGGHTRF